MKSSPRFVRSLKMNLAYLRRRSQDLGEERLPQLDKERHNFHRAIQFGLALPETRVATAEVVLQLFLLIERRNYWRDWIPTFEQLLARGKEGNDFNLSLKFNLWKQLGQLQRFDRQLEAAMESHQRALNVAEQLDEREKIAQARFNLSEDLRLQRDYREAERFGLMALEGFIECQSHLRWKAATLNTLGLIAQEQGNWFLSEQRLREAVSHWRQTSEITELTRSLNNLGLTLQENEKVEQALCCYREVTTLLAKTKSQLDQVKILLSMGTLYYNLEQWSEAERHFREAFSLKSSSANHTYYDALSAHNLGNVLLVQERFSEAEEYLRDAISFWREVDDKLMLANSVGTLGQVLRRQGKKEAQHYLDQALALLQPYLATNELAKRLDKGFRAEK